MNIGKGKGKGFPYSTPSVGPGADYGVQAVSPQVTVSYPPGGRLPLLSARPVVTSPAAEHHCPLAGTKLYCLVTEAHRCKQLAKGCYAALPRAGFEPATYWSQVQRYTRCTIAPPLNWGCWRNFVHCFFSASVSCHQLRFNSHFSGEGGLATSPHLCSSMCSEREPLEKFGTGSMARCHSRHPRCESTSRNSNLQASQGKIILSWSSCLHCFDAVSWASGGASSQ